MIPTEKQDKSPLEERRTEGLRLAGKFVKYIFAIYAVGKVLDLSLGLFIKVLSRKNKD